MPEEPTPETIAKVRRIAKRLCRHGDLDDLAQEGMVGLMRAVQRYDGRVRFWTYAEFAVKGAMLDYLRSLDAANRKERASIRAGTSHGYATVPIEDEAYRLYDRGPSPDTVAGWAEVRRAVQALPLIERMVIETRFWRGLSEPEVMAQLGLDLWWMRRITNAAVRHLRKRLGKPSRRAISG